MNDQARRTRGGDRPRDGDAPAGACVVRLLCVLAVLVVVTVAAFVLTGGGTVAIDVVRFEPVGAPAGQGANEGGESTAGLRPGLRIDTRDRLDGSFIWGGHVRSTPPYALVLNHTDESCTVAELVVDSFALRYADGSTEPAVAAIAAPLAIDFRDIEVRNSSSQGVFTTELRVMERAIDGVVARDEDVVVRVVGRFVLDSGEEVPFTVEQLFRWSRSQRTVTMFEFWSEM
jgi:hypothetical protein